MERKELISTSDLKTNKWQLYIKTENEGVIRESTKQDDVEKALTYARERWYEIQGRQRSGLKIKREKKLFDFVEEYLEEEKKRISSVPKKRGVSPVFLL